MQTVSYESLIAVSFNLSTAFSPNVVGKNIINSFVFKEYALNCNLIYLLLNLGPYVHVYMVTTALLFVLYMLHFIVINSENDVEGISMPQKGKDIHGHL